MSLDFLKLGPVESIELVLDFDKETKKTVFTFKGYHNDVITSERTYEILYDKDDIQKIIVAFETIKELLK